MESTLLIGVYPKNSTIYKVTAELARPYATIPFPSGWKANFNGESLINFHHFTFKK